MRSRWIVATLLMMLVARWVVAQRRYSPSRHLHDVSSRAMHDAIDHLKREGVSDRIMGASMASEEQEHMTTPEAT